MFRKELSQAGHVRRFVVGDATDEGWEVRVEQDSDVVRSVWYADWHRVERAVAVFTRQVSEIVAWNRDALQKSRSAAPGSQGATTENIGHM